MRCVKYGYRCDGYEIPAAITFEIFANAADRRAFEFYKERTSRSLHSLATPHFWDRLALQAAYREEAVRRMLAAFALKDEAMTLAKQSLTPVDELHLSALKQYQIALVRVKDEGASIDPSCLIMVIMMLSAFDSRRGEWAAASQHMLGVIQIGNSFIERGEKLEEQLVDALRYTEKMAASLQSVNLRVGWGPRTSVDLRPLEDLRKAHDALELLRPVVLRAASEHRAVPNTSMRDGVQFVLSKLDNWWKTYSHCTAADGWVCDCPVSYLQYIPAYLEAWYRFLRIELAYALDPGSFLDNSYDEEFRMITHPAEGFLTGISMSRHDPDAVRSCINFDTAEVALVTLAGLRCRHPLLRRDTIRILRWWKDVNPTNNADIYADLIECLMLIEEADCQSAWQTSDIKLHSRLHVVRVDFVRLDNTLHGKFSDIHDPTHFEVVVLRETAAEAATRQSPHIQFWDRAKKCIVRDVSPEQMSFPGLGPDFWTSYGALDFL